MSITGRTILLSQYFSIITLDLLLFYNMMMGCGNLVMAFPPSLSIYPFQTSFLKTNPQRRTKYFQRYHLQTKSFSLEDDNDDQTQQTTTTNNKISTPIDEKDFVQDDTFQTSFPYTTTTDPLTAFRETASSTVATFLSSLPTLSNDNTVESIYAPRDVFNYNSTTISSHGHDSSSSLTMFMDQGTSSDPEGIVWDVYIDQSKGSKERGGVATLDAFLTLAPPSLVKVHPAIISKTRGKGPTIRCIKRNNPLSSSSSSTISFEVSNVNDVDKVYRILTKHMNITNISEQAKTSLKYTYIGNAHIEKKEISKAIAAYTSALAAGYEPQEGTLLLMRATAFLQRAFQHQVELKAIVSNLAQTVPDPLVLGKMYQIAIQNPTLANPIFLRMLDNCRSQDKKFRQTKYRHGLYEYALLHAAQDSLRATQISPRDARTWVRAGDCLAELKKLKESVLYYERAVELDENLEFKLRPVMERLKKSSEFLEKAKEMGWNEDTLRLALDVAG